MTFLEKELSNQLSRVTAPESLWSQIHQQRRPLRVCPRNWLVWAIPVAATLLLAARFGVTEQLHAGAHLIRVKGAPVEAVTYRQGTNYFAMLVTTPGKHRPLNTIAMKFPDNVRRACALCHTDTF